MRWIKRLVLIVLLAAVFLYGVSFTLQNTATVSLNLLWVQLDSQPISRWLLLSFCSGLLIGLLVNLWALTKLKAQQVGLKRQLGKQQSVAIAEGSSD